MQGRRPGLYPLLHELEPMTNGTKKPSGTYVAFSKTPGVGPTMRDFETVTFIPVSKENYGHIRVTCAKGHYIVGRKYRFRMELVQIGEEDHDED